MFFRKLLMTVFLMWLGFLILKYRKFVKDWTGNFYWAEKYLGSGGTMIVLIAIALLLIFLWASIPFWWLDDYFYGNSADTLSWSTLIQ